MHYRRKAQPFNRDDRTSAAGESRCDGAHSVAHEVSGGRVEARRGAFCSARSERGRVEARRGARAKRSSPRLADDENAGFIDTATGRTSEAKFATARR